MVRCDWSSDVCSSDLGGWFGETFRNAEGHEGRAHSTAILFS